jgi:hypothetical protein
MSPFEQQQWDKIDIPTLHCIVEYGSMRELKLTSIAQNRYKTLIAQFIHNPKTFSDQLLANNAVISGVAALSFFLGPARLTPETLDVYLPKQHATQLISHLQSTEEYIVHNISETIVQTQTGIKAICRLRRGEQYIDVIQSDHQSLSSHPLSHFWCSLLMNFICPQGYCCAYPDLLAENKGIIKYTNLQADGTIGSQDDDIMYHFTNRQLTFDHQYRLTTADRLHQSEICPSKWRYFGDQYCLSGEFGRRWWPECLHLATWRNSAAWCDSCGTQKKNIPDSFLFNNNNKKALSNWIDRDKEDWADNITGVNAYVRKITNYQVNHLTTLLSPRTNIKLQQLEWKMEICLNIQM